MDYGRDLAIQTLRILSAAALREADEIDSKPTNDDDPQWLARKLVINAAPYEVMAFIMAAAGVDLADNGPLYWYSRGFLHALSDFAMGGLLSHDHPHHDDAG
jgi:hypothetical protein